MNDEWTEADEIIEEVRAIRRRIWQEFDNDPRQLGAHLRELEKHYTGPVVRLPEDDGEDRFAASAEEQRST